ncbi:hypothetical protein RCL1_007773 [Eukaryota sp. TZLM3-RCL]
MDLLDFVRCFKTDINSLVDLSDCELLHSILNQYDSSSFPPIPKPSNVSQKRSFVKTFIDQLSKKFHQFGQTVDLTPSKILVRDIPSISSLLRIVLACAFRTPGRSDLEGFLSLNNISDETIQRYSKIAEELLPQLPESPLEEEKVIEINEITDDLQVENEKLQSQIASLQKTIEELNYKISEKDAALSELNTKYSNISQRLVSLQAMSSELTFVKQEKKECEDHLRVLEQKVKDLQKEQTSPSEEYVPIDVSSAEISSIEEVYQSLSRSNLVDVVRKLIDLNKNHQVASNTPSKREEELAKQLAVSMKRAEVFKTTVDLELDVILKSFYSLGSQLLNESHQNSAEPLTFLEILRSVYSQAQPSTSPRETE